MRRSTVSTPWLHPLDKVQLSLMDKWILSKLNSLVAKVDADLTAYRIPEPAGAIQDFVDELSNWYVRRGRERFWGKGMAGDKEAAFATLYHVLVTLSKVIAPFVPFMAEGDLSESDGQQRTRCAGERPPV